MLVKRLIRLGQGKFVLKHWITKETRKKQHSLISKQNQQHPPPVHPQHSSAHFLVPKDDGQRDDNKVGRASDVLEDEEDEDGVGVVPLCKEDSSEVASCRQEGEKVNQGEVGTSVTSHPEKGVRSDPGGDQLENVEQCHGQGAKGKWHNHNNQGEDQVGEVGRRVEDPAEGDVEVPGDDDHLARVCFRLHQVIPSGWSGHQLSSKLQRASETHIKSEIAMKMFI